MDIKTIWHRAMVNPGRIPINPLNHRLLIFYIASIVWLELVYRLLSVKNLNFDFVFSILFSFAAGGLLYLVSSLLDQVMNKAVAVFLISLLCICYNVQLVYYNVFQTPLSIYSLTGAGDVTQFMDIIIAAILGNLAGIALIFVLTILLLTDFFKLQYTRIKAPVIYFILLFCILSHGISVLCVNLTGDSNISQYTLYYKTYSPQLSVGRLGLLTTMRLDLQRLVLGDGVAAAVEAINDKIAPADPVAAVEGVQSDVLPSGTDRTGDDNVQSGSSGIKGVENSDIPAETEPAEPAKDPEYNYNTMEIDFDTLIANEKDSAILGMHKYFSSAEPTRQNSYTGLFKGCNLILLTAEGFSPYAVDPELTPTLYKMMKEGFEFTNFYNPVWGVSTSDGEYAACTGLMPKAGVWSFARSGQNYMPFVMGNQFKRLGYITKAWHDHTYTYYKRNISHPNMGYDYKGVGSGLEIKKTWPESDLEMIEVTAPEYIGTQPFHTYYMTVSGHLQYNFTGNYIAKKNKVYVEDLPYSTPAKAYIACNMELEFAMKALIEKLEAAGIAENTVIAISPDHYPYGLPRECIDELAGHKAEDNFELYKSTLIIWKKGMEPVVVDEPCSSLDINPTLSNLFGLEYDSRLLMGRDILSDTPPLVIFSNWSWITDRARFNSAANKVEFTDGSEKDTEYIESINKTVAERYKYSVKILENDYYGRILPWVR